MKQCGRHSGSKKFRPESRGGTIFLLDFAAKMPKDDGRCDILIGNNRKDVG